MKHRVTKCKCKDPSWSVENFAGKDGEDHSVVVGRRCALCSGYEVPRPWTSPLYVTLPGGPPERDSHEALKEDYARLKNAFAVVLSENQHYKRRLREAEDNLERLAKQIEEHKCPT